MKILTFVLGFLLIAGCTHVSTPSPSINLNGTWKGEYKDKRRRNHHMNREEAFNQRNRFFIFRFKHDDNSIKGIVYSDPARPDMWFDLEEIKIKGNKIFFKTRLSSIELCSFKGTIEENKIHLIFQINFKNTTVTVRSDKFTVEKEL